MAGIGLALMACTTPSARSSIGTTRDETRQRAATREELLCCSTSGVPNRAARVEAAKA